MSDYFTIYFELYRTIAWPLGKLFSKLQPTDPYCSTAITEEKCEVVPIPFAGEDPLNATECCRLGSRTVSKRSLSRLVTRATVQIKGRPETPFIFIEELPTIKVTTRREFRVFQEQQEIIRTYNPSFNEELAEVLDEDDKDSIDLKYLLDSLDTDSILEVLSPGWSAKEGVFPDETDVPPSAGDSKEEKRAFIKNKYTIQANNNKVFYDPLEKCFHMYFSFGEPKYINKVLWEIELVQFVEIVKQMLVLPETEKIILAGHSMGAIISLKLALELFRLGIDTSKIQLLGSGCINIPTLFSPADFEIITTRFSQHFYILSALKEGDKLAFDWVADRNVNPLNTHFMVCDYETNRSSLIPLYPPSVTPDHLTPSRYDQDIHSLSFYAKWWALM